MEGLVHISFARTDFKCPHCDKRYNDNNDKYLDRIQNSKRKLGYTTIKCLCGDKFGMTYTCFGKAVSFKL